MPAPLLLLLVCAGLSGQTVFSGVAVNSATGEPLSGVHLKLFVPAVTGAIADPYGAVTGRDGRFSITGIPPGSYALLAERTGFVQMIQRTGVIPLPTITLNTSVTDYKLAMTPRAAIVVRVIDEYGDPVPNVTVEAIPESPGAPVAAGLNDRPPATTNGLGEARLNGGPGTFRIKATPAVVTNRAREIRTDGSSDAGYGISWHRAIEVQAGADVAVELRLARQRTISIKGTVRGARQATILLSAGDTPGRTTTTRALASAPDGSFAVADLPPAFYLLSASAGNLRSRRIEIKPDAPELVEVELTLTAGIELTGMLEITGGPPEKCTISVGSATAVTEADGAFKIGGVFPEASRMNVRPLPANAYVKTVELDGVLTSGRELDLTRAEQGSRLRIVIALDGAQLSGTVLDRDGHPLGNAVAVVILAPDRDHIFPSQDGLARDAGRYSFTGIRPGKYLVFAVDALRSGPLNSDEDLKKLALGAEEIELKPSDRIVKDLKVVTKEDVDARAKK